jgi:ABC-type dipeptide/oligopeptide/nickel transport system permease component
MTAYIARRLLSSLLALLGVTLLVFVALRLNGDPVLAIAQEAGLTREEIDALRAALRLDQPLPLQYAGFLLDAVRGDFGQSIASKAPARDEIAARLPATLQLGLAAYLLGLALALPAAVLSATRHGRLADRVIRVVSLAGISLPSFWLGLLLILVFSVSLRWLPVSGRGEGLVDGLRALVLPTITLALVFAATLTRLIRAGLVEALSADYVRTARAKGLRGRSVVVGHALRNALLPIVTFMGLQIGFLIGGAAIVETVFSWPGVGRLIVESVGRRDYPVVQAAAVLVASTLILANLAVDLLYVIIDPRIRYA